MKTPALRTYRDSITRLQYPLPTLQAVRYRTACKARFRLVASRCREGVEPSGFHRKVSVLYIRLPPFPDLSWRERESPEAAIGAGHDALASDDVRKAFDPFRNQQRSSI